MAITVVQTGSIIKVTGTTAAAATVFTGMKKVKFIYWEAPTTAGQKANVTDKNGQNAFGMTCEADGYPQQWNLFVTFDGMICDDLDSGTLYIIT